ncbi:hypothetical protein [Bradyrhizobium elkanii]|uniref:hypothetical protein n=1 Tax=Bradyrhizobium elkanii TaxID=29448 RepID=UPI003D21368D
MPNSDQAIIRVELLEEIERRGIFRYSVPVYGVEGRSRWPLLDACREIKRMGGDTACAAGLFRVGRSRPDLTVSSIETGALLTVAEPDRGKVRVVRFRAFAATEATE